MSMSALWSVTFSLDSASSIHIAARPSSRTSFSVCCVIGGSSPTRRCRLWLIHARLWSTHSGNICRKSGGCQYRFSAITHVSRISSFGSDSAAVPLSCLRCLPPMLRDSFDATLTSAAPVAPNTSSVHYEPSCDTCDTAARLRQTLPPVCPRWRTGHYRRYRSSFSRDKYSKCLITAIGTVPWACATMRFWCCWRGSVCGRAK